MDRPAIEELLAFTDLSWNEHVRAIEALSSAMLTKPAPGSGWPTLCDALAHINFAYDRWLAEPDRTSEPVIVAPARSWDDLDAYRRRVRDHCRGYLDSLSDAELTTSRPMNVDDEMLSYSPADILTHVLLHERAHHGDISTLFYQLGVEPPVVEYRFSLSAIPRS